MASPLLSLPREVRDMISSIVIIQTDQPFRLQAQHLAPKENTTPPSGSASGTLATICKQLRAEYFPLLKRIAFTPGTKTVIPIHDFNFSHLTAFVLSLPEHEIRAANRNGNFVVSLVVLDPTALVSINNNNNIKAKDAKQHQRRQSLLDWVRVCGTTGLEVEYTAQWSRLGLEGLLREMEVLVGGTREGRKILEGLKGRSLRGWSWEGWQASLVRERTGKERRCG